LALADLHTYSLARNDSAQPRTCECCGVDEDIFSPAILLDKTEPLVGFV
jgi:hypothetical protein